ncbi:MAG: ATPase inhibitor subunit zeta [Magnetospirillum sp.]|nr:ATPase inhibitor subunit zeta [Magnetospirillum sp.]
MGDFVHTVDAKGVTSQLNFVAGQEAGFWIRARRNHLLAQWFSDLTDEDQQSYVRLLLDADFAKVETREAAAWILTKIRNDLMGFGIFLSLEDLQELAERFRLQAWRERQGERL